MMDRTQKVLAVIGISCAVVAIFAAIMEQLAR